MNIRKLRKIEWWIPLCVIILCGIGLVALFSASYDSGLDEFKKQAMWMGISIIMMIIVMMIDYKIIIRLSPILYGISIISLIAVLFTEPVNGATSWFEIGDGLFSLQPAEISKIFVILFLSYIISILQRKGRDEINRIPKLAIILLVIAVPLILIILEPDYGTATAYIIASVLMIFVAGIDKKYVITAITVIAIAVPITYKFILPDHAKTRIDTFLNPEADPRGAGYNVLQSKLAIGAGKITGMGNTIRIFISKDNRLYFFCNRRRNGIYSSRQCNNIKYNNCNKINSSSKRNKRRSRGICSSRNSRNNFISHIRKYRNDNGVTTYNRSSSIICKLWWNINDDKFHMYRNIIKYKQSKKKWNV